MSTPDPLAVAAMVAYCGWDPTEVVVDRQIVLDGDGSPLLRLPSLHVTAVSQIVATDAWGYATTYRADATPEAFGLGVYGSSVFGGPVTPSTIGVGAPITWSENGLVTLRRGCGGWPDGSGNIAVTYSGGYSETPADLAAALASLSKRFGGPLAGVSSARMGTAAFNYGAQIASGGLLVVEQLVFDGYRIVRAA